jgi:single-strand DNA-binding protein
MSYQKLILVGHLGRDPELRYTGDGTPVTTLSLATTRKWRNSDGSQGEETTWFRISVWRRQAEITAQYLRKGRQVMVEGRLAPDKETGGPRIWTRQDGTPGASYEITADRVIFLGGGRAEGSDEAAEPEVPYGGEDEIPL